MTATGKIKRTPRPYWTDDVIRRLIALWDAGILAKLIAFEIGRTERAVLHMRLRLNLAKRIR